MKLVPLLTALGASLAGLCSTELFAADDEGVALAIIYDTSGSMRDTVADKAGRKSPKFEIANRALIAVASQIQTFATKNPAGTPRKIDVGLYTFQGERSKEVVKFGPFDQAALVNFANKFSQPNGNTPLGNSLAAATRVVLGSPLSRRHVLIITDGINTAGPKPEAVLPGLKQDATRKQATVSVHFVAFDIAAAHFNPVKKLGATVVAAADEAQLNSQLEFILQRKILLEDEEPPKTK